MLHQGTARWWRVESAQHSPQTTATPIVTTTPRERDVVPWAADSSDDDVESCPSPQLPPISPPRRLSSSTSALPAANGATLMADSPQRRNSAAWEQLMQRSPARDQQRGSGSVDWLSRSPQTTTTFTL